MEMKTFSPAGRGDRLGMSTDQRMESSSGTIETGEMIRRYKNGCASKKRVTRGLDRMSLIRASLHTPIWIGIEE